MHCFLPVKLKIASMFGAHNKLLMGLISIKALKIMKIKPGLTHSLCHAVGELQIMSIRFRASNNLHHHTVIYIQVLLLFTAGVLLTSSLSSTAALWGDRPEREAGRGVRATRHLCCRPSCSCPTLPFSMSS